VDSSCSKPRGWPRCWWWPGPGRRARWRLRAEPTRLSVVAATAVTCW